VIEAEQQVVLNTFSEHDFLEAFKNGKSTDNGAYTHKGTTLRVMVASRPKVSRPDCSTKEMKYKLM
jgi:hypothetical protein